MRSKFGKRISRVFFLCGFLSYAGSSGCNNGAIDNSPAANQPAASQTTNPPATIADSSEEAVASGNVDPAHVTDDGFVLLGGEDQDSSKQDPAPTDIILDPGVVPAENRVEGTPSPATGDVSTSGIEARTVAAEPVSSKSKQADSSEGSGVLATEAEKNQKIAEDWPQPQAVIFVSGQQHGYIEPCGCTGLDNQKGGLIRRDTLLEDLRARGWPLVPVDVGNQVRRIGRQAEIKFKTTVDGLEMMDYQAVALGEDDLKLSSIELIQVAGSDAINPGAFISANLTFWGDSTLFPPYRVVEVGGRKIGITAILGREYEKKIQTEDIEFADPLKKLPAVVGELKSEGCDFVVLLAHASLEESRTVAEQVKDLDLVVTSGGFGEPTLHPEKIEGSKAVMVQVGTKGMYGGIVGLFDDAEQPLRYQKIAISSQFSDSPRMLERFAEYQRRLQQEGFESLGASPVAYPGGREFVGSETCGECHTTAYEIWENTPHAHATDSVVAANNDRGGIPRHFDPECVACHATGWNAAPESLYPYKSGFASLEQSPHLTGSGCENCHGPGKEHVDAEYGDIVVNNDTLLKLRQQMVLKYERARERCLVCHDLDNSPDFHNDGAFEEYWERVKHIGKD